MPASAPPVPRCPLTGAPAKRTIARISRRFLTDLWRYAHGIDISHLTASVEAVTLWESPCGLAFFDPMLAGDARFYDALYGRRGWYAHLLRQAATRGDYRAAARHVTPGSTVLDVGCGDGSFRMHVPEAVYTGLDPFVVPADAQPGVSRATLADHAATHAEHYDIVTAFQFIEHAADPLALAKDMTRVLKPGGRLLLSVPHWPSPLTQIPNFVLNAPPHHVTWWNEGALRALCDVAGLEVVEIARPPAYPLQAPVCWIDRFSVVTADEPFFKPSRRWYASVLAALPLAWLAGRMKALPSDAQPIDMFLAARKRA